MFITCKESPERGRRRTRYQCLVRNGGVPSPKRSEAFGAWAERKKRCRGKTEEEEIAAWKSIRFFSGKRGAKSTLRLRLRFSRILEFSEFSDGEAKFREFFETSPRNVGWVILEKEKTIRKDSRGEERERQGRLLNEINERSNDRQEVLIHFSRRRTAPARSRSFNSLINTESADILSLSLSLFLSHPPTSSKRRNEESWTLNEASCHPGRKGVGKKIAEEPSRGWVGRPRKKMGANPGGGKGAKRVTTMKLDVCTRPGPKEKNIRVRKEWKYKSRRWRAIDYR